MTGQTPGQAAYEARVAAWQRRMSGLSNPGSAIPWASLTNGMQADEEAGAQEVLSRAFPCLREQLRKTRTELNEARAKLARVQEITEGIALSAQVTGPSKKSQIEDKIARELLAALQCTETLQESE